MTQYKIEKDIPLTPRRPAKYPLRDMAVGDSFAVPLGGHPAGAIQRLLFSAAKYARISDARIRIATRREGDAVRVWRIK